ncbi:pantoate--beta-alanine ligase [Clostridium vincentii]|uniref:Pantothenate synthetase n=1 Tax=Clostridium vincentii TaxID=52704 RepID=A0A2T0BCE6_9CLOT|nr:pantoate--beta-alanine ligase [Clostridium vincentii]PRR81558.1 Pantothenate synthetase [Clostridium vincentii]
MQLEDRIKKVKEVIKQWKKEGLTVGFIPTMGYLHEGHESLIKKASEENDRVIVSIFVNPIQFGPNEDLENYPKDLDRDTTLCLNAGADLIFNPDKEEMYFDDFCTIVNMNGLTENLCGKSRPSHFAGVCTVVSKLFNIVTPDKAYFGQKDAQQLAVIKRMVRDLSIDVEIVGCSIIREEDGLAKSSRNTYLSKEERIAAIVLNKSLKLAKESLEKGERSSNNIINSIKNTIDSEKLAKIDYIQVVDALSMENIQEIKGPTLIAIAIYIGKTRLIDNFTFKM